MPRPLRLLHVRAPAAARRAGVPDARRGARDRARGRGGRLPRGAVHARREARGALPRGARRARRRTATRRRSTTSRAARGSCSTRPACCPTPTRACMDATELARLRPVAPSQGMMIETTVGRLDGARRAAPRLARQDAGARGSRRCGRGRGARPVHHRHPRRHRRDARRADRGARAIARLGERHGHVQEVIVQNFRPSRARGCTTHPEPSPDELLWTIAVARLVLAAGRAPAGAAEPELRRLPALLDAGIDDWGGVSPVTADHVNPERRGPRSSGCARRPRPRASRSRRGSRSIPSATSAATLASTARACLAARSLPRCADGAAGLAPRGRPLVRRRRTGPTLPFDRPTATRIAALDGRAERARRGRDRHAVPRPRPGGQRGRRTPPTSCAARSSATPSPRRNRNINYTNVCTSSAGSARSRRARCR